MDRDRRPGSGRRGEDSSHYGAYYYANCCGSPYGRSADWLNQFRGVAERIAQDIAPGSVLDAGCAMGLLVETLDDRGIEAEGIDISEYAIDRVHESVRDRCRVGSILEPFGSRYDLIVSIEVVEHLPRATPSGPIANFCDHADDVILSTTPFDYKEATHFNVQPPEYWADLFARHGFFRDVDYDCTYITPWASRFRRESKTTARLVSDYERTLWRLHQENVGARQSLVEHQNLLAIAEGRLALSRERAAALETSVRELEARAATEETFDQALRRTVAAWSSHVAAQDQAIRNLWSYVDDRDRAVGDRDRQIVELHARLASSEAALAASRSLHLDGLLAAEASTARPTPPSTRSTRAAPSRSPTGSPASAPASGPTPAIRAVSF